MWALDELDRVLGGDRLASKPSQHAAGEWDAINNLSPRTRRRLRGAGYMRRGGLQPDQLAELVRDRVSAIYNTDDAMAWYIHTCLVAIREARILAHRTRHARVARRNGHPTYYAYRTALAREKGYGSVWDERRMRKWT